jgi:drug/metabolite transporter (DMT)-like permease
VSNRLSPNLMASLLILGAFSIFCAMAVLIRMIGTRIPILEVIFIRQVISFLLMSPWYIQYTDEILHPTGLKLHLTRGLLAIGAMACGLTATIHLPLADMTAIQMSEVLMATALAAALLGEGVGWRRWSAACVGFIGVLIMVRPFGGGFESASLIALLGAFCGAGSMIAVRMGAAHDRTFTVLFWQGLVVLGFVSPLMFYLWVTPTLQEAGIILVMGIIFTLGGWLFTKGTRMGATSAIAPLHYVRLLMMAVLGFFMYGEVPTYHTAAGGFLVLAAATYTIGRNAIRQVKPAAPDSSQT